MIYEVFGDKDILYVPSTGRLPQYLLKRYGLSPSQLKNKKVLDVGSGTSEIARYLHERYGIQAKQLDCWYFSKKVSFVRSTAVKVKYLPSFYESNGEFLINGLAQDTGLEDNSVDIILSSELFRHFNGQQFASAIKEFLRILRPGGKIYIISLGAGKKQRSEKVLSTMDIEYQWIEMLAEYAIEGKKYRLVIKKG